MSTGAGERERLLALINGFRATQVTYVLAKLGVPDRLAAAPATAAELAAATGVDADRLGRVLRLSAFFGLTREIDEERFALTDLGDGLRTDAPTSLRALAVMLGQQHYQAWGDLMHAVATGEAAFHHVFGTSLFEYMAAHPAAQADFDAGMAGNVGLQLAPLVTVFDFSSKKLVVDVGGGNGAVVAAIMKANPSVSAVVYDQPQVLAGAESNLRRQGLLDRCRLEPGNFFDAVPAGGDVYVLSHIIHDWEDERALRILRNCRAAMRDDAVLLLLEAVMAPHGVTSPVTLNDVNMMVLLTGRERTEAEFAAILDQAGLRLARVAPLSERRSLLEARPA